ncbi:MAG: bifunctional 4-hydroxy-2-oxoglutarate aldolase/2-dehydro-3-deoxy-phosphogluconate aldolase [Spirochaetes bacterium]|nr:bifunctional 4-hydroxy-2-oxoglutarate aldolase/2-dehydro-3-deoxy-phosphogluconate aldolase [Spirochaetota bacterium]
MARFKKIHTLSKMESIGLIPVFYHADAAIAKQVAGACHAGGALVMEFTNRGDFAWEVFSALEKYVRTELPDMILGVGSIVDPYTASLYIANGANFVVGPVLNAEVAKLCNRHGVPYMPGCGSATEVQQAQELGSDIVKVFPGDSVGGPDFVKSVKGPMPWTSIMPTGGVSPTYDSLSAWLKAGVTCMGVGSNLITKEILAKGDYKKLADDVKTALSIIAEIRSKK